MDSNDLKDSNKFKDPIKVYSALQTVNPNNKYFSAQEIEGAYKTRAYEEFLLFPGTLTLKSYVATNLIRNFNITINRVDLISGPYIPLIQGQMTRHVKLV